MAFLRRTGDDVELHYAVAGAGGAAVVFLHGLAGHGGEWVESAAALADHRRTIRIDQRGHGRSTRNPVDLSRQTFADDVAAVIADAGIDPPVTLVGQSMGAHTALLVADQYPELVGRLIMVEGDVGGGGPEPLEQVTHAIRSWPRSFASYTEVCDFFGGNTLRGRTWADGYHQLNGRWWPRFDPANVPVMMAPIFLRERWDIWDRLLIHTDLVLADNSAIAADRITEMCARRPQTARHTVADAGHDLHLEQPRKWTELLRRLVNTEPVDEP